MTLKKYIWVLGILCTIAISYLLARIVTLFVEGSFFSKAVVMMASELPDGDSPLSVSGKGASDIEIILKRNFFDAEETIITKKDEDPVPKDDTAKDDDKNTKKEPMDNKAVETSLDLTLYSTFSVGDGRGLQSSCVVKTNRSTDTFTIKDKEPFGAGTKIVRIISKKVEFINNNRLEYVKLEDFAKAGPFSRGKKPVKDTVETKLISDTPQKDPSAEVQREGDSFKIPRSEVNAALENLPKLYTDIRAVPYFKDDKAQGFKLLSVKRGSFFQKLGLRRGDILSSVNDKVLDIQSGMETFNTLKTETSFKVQLERRGEEKTFSYEITE
ncbi:MAG: hypothetical protein HQM16_04375 [Deltaproteobacteria bacterium]|nr:hypothetical protein [Deltaproteobacteria bacterium]